MRLIGNVEKDAQVRAVASGALPSGDAVVVNSDGTVSVVGIESASTGSESVFESASSSYLSSTFDSSNNKVVVAYKDNGNSGLATAVVGTVSGSSITFGTPVVFSNGSTFYISATFDSNANKIVIAFRDGGLSNFGTFAVGTVSGNSISFSPPTVFKSGQSDHISATFDSSNNKVVISYDNSSLGKAIVGTVSGTTMSFGSEATFNSGGTNWISSTFDSNSNKVVIAYQDESNSDHGTAVVGTVSGTSISFGSESVFKASSVQYVSLAFDSNSNKIVTSYVDGSNSDVGEVAIGTVSGTSISFGTSVQFSTALSYVSCVFDVSNNKVVIAYREDGTTYGTVISGTVSGTSISFDSTLVFKSSAVFWVSAVYDSSQEKVAVSYSDGGNSNYGTAVVFQNQSTNLTSENFLGFAAHTYADGQSALVNSTCTVDRNQSGLTAGQTYYVQTDGSLGTTAADPSVVAGTAISSTEIIVKG